MRRDILTAALLSFIAGNLTGVLGTVALFGRELGEFKAQVTERMVAMDGRVSRLESEHDAAVAIVQSGISRKGAVR